MFPILIVKPLPAIIKIKVGLSERELGNGTEIDCAFTVYSGKGFLNKIINL